MTSEPCCRFCGCTERRACRLPAHIGELVAWLMGMPAPPTCFWLLADVCAAPGCLRRLADAIDPQRAQVEIEERYELVEALG